MTGDRLLEADVALLAAAAGPPHRAHVELSFKADADGHTYLARQRVRYPFHVGRSLHAPGDPEGMPTYYVQCCSGGLFDSNFGKAAGVYFNVNRVIMAFILKGG